MAATSRYVLQDKSRIGHRKFIGLAVPLILSALSTPLLGAVDTAMVGRLPDAAYIGGIAVGSLIFNTMYWLLGFLRVSTSGFTAQAHGAKNEHEVKLMFLRPLLLAVGFGLLFILFQDLIQTSAFWMIQPSEEVIGHAAEYFDIRIWGAPFALMNYAIVGWLIGLSRVRSALFLQVFMNLLNIGLDAVFVLVLNMGVGGVAFATLISEITAFMIGMVFVLYGGNFTKFKMQRNQIFDSNKIYEMMKVNRDLFIRTVCLLTVFGLFTEKGATFGDQVLAANAILLQVHFIMAYIFDGIANAASILVGRAMGAKHKELYSQAVKLSAVWAFFVSIVLAVTMVSFDTHIVSLFTNIEAVKQIAISYGYWVAMFPIVGFWGLQLQGIFSGATEVQPLRNSMVISLIVFLISYWSFIPFLGNDGLWFSFILFSLSRSLVLWKYLFVLEKRLAV
ncbi:MATE family efflux transporter [Aeribacillus pallidus]|uniref:MATE family efflux transporter n=1 Tax=Aeribacillus pallidus TaxID=33936 RepID=UPI003D1BAFBF